MRRMQSVTKVAAFCAALFFLAPWASAQAPQRQTQEDDYTRYELLGPDTAQFRILYEVTATTPERDSSSTRSARAASPPTKRRRPDDRAAAEVGSRERRTGAEAEGHPTADLETEWLKVHLARPVPKGGEGRVLIDKTYKDAKSYFRDGDTIVFDRSLGIRRNAVVLPPGYRLISCNVPSQVMPTADGRIMITFLNTSAAAAPLVIRAKPGLAAFSPKIPSTMGPASTSTMASQIARLCRSRASGSRDRVLPERSVDALVQPLPRLHRVASRRLALLQHRPRRQHGFESVGGAARYRRSAEGRDDQRRRAEEARPRCRRTGGRHDADRRDRVSQR